MAAKTRLWQQVSAPGGDGMVSVWRCYDITIINEGTEEQDAIIGDHVDTTNQAKNRPEGFNKNGAFFVDNTSGAKIQGVTLQFTDYATNTIWLKGAVIPKGKSVFTVAEFTAFTNDPNNPKGAGYTSPNEYDLTPVFTLA